jgi:hypothetical protein
MTWKTFDLNPGRSLHVVGKMKIFQISYDYVYLNFLKTTQITLGGISKTIFC